MTVPSSPILPTARPLDNLPLPPSPLRSRPSFNSPKNIQYSMESTPRRMYNLNSFGVPERIYPCRYLQSESYSSSQNVSFCSCNKMFGEKCSFCWAWDIRSNAPSSIASSNNAHRSSVPSIWCYAPSLTSYHSFSQTNSKLPTMSLSQWFTSTGQRLKKLSPDTDISPGDNIIVSLRRELPQEFWNDVSVLFRLENHPDITYRLLPRGIKDGRKICVKLFDYHALLKKPTKTELTNKRDWEVLVYVNDIVIPGSLPLEVK